MFIASFYRRLPTNLTPPYEGPVRIRGQPEVAHLREAPQSFDHREDMFTHARFGSTKAANTTDESKRAVDRFALAHLHHCK